MTTVTFSLNGTATFASFEDSNPSQAAPNAANGAADRFTFGNPTTGNITKGILRIPMASGGAAIPTNATVSSATLTLTRLNASATPKNWQVRRLLVNWTAAQVTWNNRSTGNPWGTAGAKGVGDTDATIIATGTTPTGASSTITVGGTGFTALVQGWVNGSIPNYGILFEAVGEDTAGGTAPDVASSERATTTQRPVLTVVYSVPTPPNVTTSDPTVTNLSGIATVTVSFDASFGSAVSIDYATADGTAHAGVDYTATNGTLTFAPGESSKSILIPITP